MPARRSMPRRLCLALLWIAAAMACGQQDISHSSCPVCEMDVQPAIQAAIRGQQRVLACEMEGHLHQLTTAPHEHLGAPIEVDIASDRIYRNATTMACPVCGMGFAHLHYAVPWGPMGNQKIFACSLAHAQLILARPMDYIGVPDQHGEFCNMGSVDKPMGSVMFNGFQLAIGKNRTCATLLFPSWVLSSRTKYALGLVVVLLLGVSLEGIGRARSYAEQSVHRHFGCIVGKHTPRSVSQSGDVYEKLTESSGSSVPNAQHRYVIPMWSKLVLAMLYATHLSIAYLLMLVAMMFETLYFLAVISGLTLGFLAFNDPSKRQQQIDPCCSS